MPRYRSIHARDLADPVLGRLSDRARLLHTQVLLALVDDRGNCPCEPAWLRGQGWPFCLEVTARDVALALRELAHAGLVEPYRVAGQLYGHLTRFAQQRVDRPAKHPIYPLPEQGELRGNDALRGEEEHGPEQETDRREAARHARPGPAAAAGQHGQPGAARGAAEARADHPEGREGGERRDPGPGGVRAVEHPAGPAPAPGAVLETGKSRVAAPRSPGSSGPDPSTEANGSSNLPSSALIGPVEALDILRAEPGTRLALPPRDATPTGLRRGEMESAWTRAYLALPAEQRTQEAVRALARGLASRALWPSAATIAMKRFSAKLDELMDEAQALPQVRAGPGASPDPMTQARERGIEQDRQAAEAARKKRENVADEATALAALAKLKEL